MIKEIYDYIKEIPIIDTHEHLPSFEKDRPKRDVIAEYLTQYLLVDVISAGLTQKEYALLAGEALSVKEKWKIVEPYWEACRYTGYAQALDISVRELYGLDGIRAETIEALNEAFLCSYQKEHFKYVLKEKSNIRVSILDTWGLQPADPEYFVTANRIDALIQPQSGRQILELEELTGITISSFEHYLEACEVCMEKFSEASKILKCGLAYSRTLNFERTTRADAETAYNHLFHSGYGHTIWQEDRMYSCSPALTNYLFRYVIGIAQEKGMILQIHTGIQEGNGNILGNSNPAHLNEIFMAYPKMKFDLFHIGYPYQNELGTLCKMFPNVYINMCWAHIVSPVASRRALSEWLELFSYKKISGFGGDYLFVDGVYGHQYMARKNIAEVLSEKVKEGLFDTGKACEIGKAILYDNPVEIFELGEGCRPCK